MMYSTKNIMKVRPHKKICCTIATYRKYSLFPGSQQYFHNTIPHVSNSTYNKVFVNSHSSQPWPIPANPPTNLEAIFGREIAKTRWQPPQLLGLQGNIIFM